MLVLKMPGSNIRRQVCNKVLLSLSVRCNEVSTMEDLDSYFELGYIVMLSYVTTASLWKQSLGGVLYAPS